MAETVRVEYVLSDRISNKLKKIQAQAAKTEAALAGIDKRLEKLSKPAAANKFADNWQKSFTKVNKAATTHGKKIDALTTSTEKWGKAANKSRQELRYTRDTLKSLDRHINTTTKSIDKQQKAMLALSNETAQAANHMFAMRDAERETSKAMTVKNRETLKQRKHLSGLDRDTRRLTRSMKSGNRAVDAISNTFRKARNQSYFAEAVEQGGDLYFTFRKMLGIIPLLTTGLGGVANIISSIGTGVVTLSASLGRLSGALAAVGGLYASLGIAGAVGKGTVNSLFKPMVKNAEQLKNIEKQIANNQATAAKAAQSRAASLKRANLAVVRAENALSTGKATQSERDGLTTAQLNASLARSNGGTGNDQRNLIAMQEKQAKLLQETNGRYAEFNSQLETLKGNYRTLMSGDANANIDFALAAFGSLNKIMNELAPSVQRVQGSIRGFMGKGLAIFMKPQNMKVVQQAFTESARAVDILGNIMEKVAPLFLKVMVYAQRYANRVLSTLDAWLEVKESTGEIAEFAERTNRFFHRSEKSLYGWTRTLKNLGGAFANIFKAAAPTTAKFESDLESVTNNFKKWTANSGNFKRMEVFFAQTYRTLQAVGRLVVSIFAMFGQASGGGGANSKAIADSMVDFLDTLGRGLRNFGRAAGNSLTTIGPALTEFFKALGPLIAALDVTPAVEALLTLQTNLLKFFDFFVSRTGSGGVFNAIANMAVLMTGLGLIFGNLLSPLGKVVQFFSQIGKALAPLRGAGKAGGLLKGAGVGGKIGKGIGVLESATALPVRVVNFHELAAMETVGDMIPGGGMGRGKGGKGLGKWGGRAAKWGGRVAFVAGVGYVAYEGMKVVTDDKMDANKKASRFAGAGLGAAGGAAAGAAVGSVVPVIGTAAGAGIGAIAGATYGITGGADGLFADPFAAAEKKRKEKQDKAMGKMGDVLALSRAGILGIEDTQKELVKAATTNLDLNKRQGRLAFLAATEAVGMSDAAGRQLLQRENQLQQQRREARLLSRIRAQKIENNKVASDLAKKMGIADPTAGATAVSQSKLGVRVDNAGKKVRVVKTEAQATSARRGIAAAGRYGQDTGIDRVMTQQEWTSQQALGGAGVVGQLQDMGSVLKPALEELKSVQAKATQDVVDIYKTGSLDADAALKEYERIMDTQLNSIAEISNRVGRDIVANTVSWRDGTNAAMSGVVVPGAGSATSVPPYTPPATPTAANGGYVWQKYAGGGVIGGDPRRGDVVPIMAAGGEVILNEEQQQRLGKTNIHAALSGSITPHDKSFDTAGRAKDHSHNHAKGGRVRSCPQCFASGGYVQGAIPPMDADTRSLASKAFARGFSATSGYRSNSTTFHGRGQALDFGDSVNSMQAVWDFFKPMAGQLEELLGPQGSYFNGSFSPSVAPGHYDHVHVAYTGDKGDVGAGGFGGGGTPIQIPAPPNFGNSNMGVRTQKAVNGLASSLQARVNTGANPTNVTDASGAKAFAQSMLSQHGWGPDQFGPLDKLWTKESNWRWNADNPTSDAYGIPQALPGSKMASAGADWMTNPATQVKWGLGYIKGRYGNPANAWAHSVANNWYKNGGEFVANGPQTIGVGEAGPERVSIKPLSAGGSRNRNGSSTGGGGGNVFNTNISVGVLVGNEAALKQLTEMVGDRFAEDVRKAQATVVNGD